MDGKNIYRYILRDMGKLIDSSDRVSLTRLQLLLLDAMTQTRMGFKQLSTEPILLPYPSPFVTTVDFSTAQDCLLVCSN